jgi:hypothetical protein
MIEFLIKIIERLLEWLKTWRKPGEKPPEPIEPPFYMDEMKKPHPGLSGEDLAQVVELTALEDTFFYIPSFTNDGHYLRNKAGNLILKQMAGEGIPKGATVEVYKWAFPVDGGNVRESRWHITDSKGLIDISKFTKPE